MRMTPDQSLKAAILGETVPARPAPDKTPKTPGARPARTGPSRVYRWGIKLLILALMVLITRGLMRAPEVQAMLADAKTAVLELIDREVAARQSAGTEPAPQATPASQSDLPQGIAADIPVSSLPESRIMVRRPDATEPATPTLPEQAASETTPPALQSDAAPAAQAPQSADQISPQADTTAVTATAATPETVDLSDTARISGPVTAILAGNLMDVDDITVLIDDLACPAPDSEAGRFAALGLARITRAASLECEVLGEVGDAALRAACALPSGELLSDRMKSETECQ